MAFVKLQGIGRKSNLSASVVCENGHYGEVGKITKIDVVQLGYMILVT